MARDRWRRGIWLGVLASLVLVVTLAAPAAAQVAEADPDLTMAGSSSARGQVGPGQRFSYELVVANEGDGWASEISVLSRIPRGVRVVNLLPTMEGGRCSVAGVGAVLRFLVICERPALGPAETAAIAIDVEVVTAAYCLPLTLRAAVTATGEPRPVVDASNTVILTDGTRCPAAVGLAVTGPRFAHDGDRIDLTYRVSNRGPVGLSGITVSDPACDAPPRVVSGGATDGILSPGDTRTYACVATVAGSGRVRHTARVRALDPAGTLVSDARSTVVDVLTPSLRIVVSSTPASGRPGSVVVHRYRVINTGDAELREIMVRDGDRRVGTIRRLRPGGTVTVRRVGVFPRADGRVVRTVRVKGHDRLGLAVSGKAPLVLRVLPAWAQDPDPGTAFTGPQEASLLLWLTGLSGTLGVLCLWATRRPRDPTA
ncbi:MAG: DUF7507 domain-containing protein [Actinomycetota bacterium]